MSHEQRFIWFRVAKVGTRSILAHLDDAGVELDAAHPYDVRYQPDRYRDYFKFAFVRNPWARLVSCWRSKVVEDNSTGRLGLNAADLDRVATFSGFVDWVAGLDLEHCDPHLRLQTALVDLDEVDFLGRQETFATDLSVVLNRIGVDVERIRLENRSGAGGQSWRDAYSPELMERVANLYDKDVRVLGYSF